MPDDRDPLGYYALLGVAQDADAAAIKAAYRRLAKRHHPDHDRSPDATGRFQRLQQAWSVLGDPLQRAAYDSFARQMTRAATPRDIAPVCCDACGKVTAQPRFVIYHLTFSFLVGTVRRPVAGIWCRRCADRKMLRATLVTWVAAWWGLPLGPIHGLRTLIGNLRGGSMPAALNAQILARQALAMLQRGQLELAQGIMAQAASFTPAPEHAEAFRQLRASIGPPARPLADQWRRGSLRRTLAASPCLGLAALAVAIVQEPRPGPVDRSAALTQVVAPASLSPLATPVMATSGPAAEPPIEVVEVTADTLNLRDRPALTGRVLGRAEAGQRFVVLERSGDWLKVQLSRQHDWAWLSTRFVVAASTTDAAHGCAADARQPVGGTLRQGRRGRHALTVHNGLPQPALVKLRAVATREQALLGYVPAGGSGRFDELPEGSFDILVETGQAYSTSCGHFVLALEAFRFDQPAELTTTRDDDHLYASEVSVTLNKVWNGNATTTPMAIGDF